MSGHCAAQIAGVASHFEQNFSALADTLDDSEQAALRLEEMAYMHKDKSDEVASELSIAFPAPEQARRDTRAAPLPPPSLPPLPPPLVLALAPTHATCLRASTRPRAAAPPRPVACA